MNDEDVTRVTRNKHRVPDEVKLLIDVVAMFGTVYYVTHPDCLDTVRDTARKYWSKFVHHASVWASRQEIRNLPETPED